MAHSHDATCLEAGDVLVELGGPRVGPKEELGSARVPLTVWSFVRMSQLDASKRSASKTGRELSGKARDCQRANFKSSKGPCRNGHREV